MELLFFFFNATATTEIYPLSLHDALPISYRSTGSSMLTTRARTTRRATKASPSSLWVAAVSKTPQRRYLVSPDRKSTRLNSSHSQISYAVLCLNKKTTPPTRAPQRDEDLT